MTGPLPLQAFFAPIWVSVGWALSLVLIFGGAFIEAGKASLETKDRLAITVIRLSSLLVVLGLVLFLVLGCISAAFVLGGLVELFRPYAKALYRSPYVVASVLVFAGLLVASKRRRRMLCVLVALGAMASILVVVVADHAPATASDPARASYLFAGERAGGAASPRACGRFWVVCNRTAWRLRLHPEAERSGRGPSSVDGRTGLGRRAGEAAGIGSGMSDQGFEGTS